MKYEELLSKSIAKINTLHYTLHLGVKDLIYRAHAEDIYLVVTEALRTREYQASLYAQGRTKPGKIVTNTIDSNHLYGVAFDVAVLSNGSISWPNDNKLWKRIGEIGKEQGFSWGGDWVKFQDFPHFEFLDEKPGGQKLTLSQLKSGKRPSAPPY